MIRKKYVRLLVPVFVAMTALASCSSDSPETTVAAETSAETTAETVVAEETPAASVDTEASPDRMNASVEKDFDTVLSTLAFE